MGFEGSRGHLGPLSPQIGRVWQVTMLYIDNPYYYIYIENTYGSRFFKYRRFLSVIGGKRLGKHPHLVVARTTLTRYSTLDGPIGGW